MHAVKAANAILFLVFIRTITGRQINKHNNNKIRKMEVKCVLLLRGLR